MKLRSAQLCRVAFVAVGFVAACDQSSSDMGEQPKAKAQSASSFFSDGTSSRPRVAGTVARNADNGGVPTTMPFEITRDRIERGQEAFNISCSVCHGRLGNGYGMIVQRGFVRPPSFHVPRLIQAPDSHFYDVITNGYGAMFPYGDRVPAERRWEIIAYVRALQTAGEGEKLADASRATLLIGGDPNHGDKVKGGRR